jgi:ribonuclease Z
VVAILLKRPLGDTEITDGLSEYVRDPDVLVIEATFLDRDLAMARDSGHLTAAKAAPRLWPKES